ncbi:MAG: hypothetical protein ABEJ68_10915 [Halobacteriaceae archaeon]
MPGTKTECDHCGAAVEGERGYRRHLHDAHDPSELGPIDRRRYEQVAAEPTAVRRTAGTAVATLRGLQYPVDGGTAVRYAWYGFAGSVSVAVLLGVAP